MNGNTSVRRIGAITSLWCGAILNLGFCRYAGKGQGEVSLPRRLRVAGMLDQPWLVELLHPNLLEEAPWVPAVAETDLDEACRLRAQQRWLWKGRRVYLFDGTTVTMPDTPENQEAYPQVYNQQAGLGFPIGAILATHNPNIDPELNKYNKDRITQYAGCAGTVATGMAE